MRVVVDFDEEVGAGLQRVAALCGLTPAEWLRQSAVNAAHIADSLQVQSPRSYRAGSMVPGSERLSRVVSFRVTDEQYSRLVLRPGWTVWLRELVSRDGAGVVQSG